MSKKELSFKGRVEPARAVNFLNDLVAGLNSGGFYLQNGDDYIGLKPNQHLLMEVEASQKKGKDKITIELSWDREDIQTEDMKLRITSAPPQSMEKKETEKIEDTVKDG
ncbi:MAG: amphi-Trp domain-containing protein [candidate division Zixibacteria bacterium]|jgi:amphi-Trp domain-containing protein|nr:amphi-Trp domain-containing protein [candidate division Zixibacteria bacterium]